MTTTITGGALGRKAVSLSDFDDFLDYLIDHEGDNDPQDLYACVPWCYWCANLIANCVGQTPRAYYAMDLPEDEEEEEKEQEFAVDLVPIDWQVRMWLQLHGDAFVLKRQNRVKLLDLQVLNANTMKVMEVDNDGRPSLFLQRVGAKEKRFTADEMVYFQKWSPRHDVGPGIGGGKAGAVPGSLIKNANLWAAAFFGNGAIPAVMLTTEGAVPPVEKDRIQARWKEMLQGVKKAFKTLVLERGLKPTVIGQPIKDLAMPELESTKREQILAAHMIPPGLAEAKTNRAERDALQYELWTQTIVPLLTIHTQPEWNRQLFNPLGLRLVYHYEQVEIIERAEIAKAESQSFLASGVVYPAYDANLISIEEARRVINRLFVAADMPGLDEQFTPEERMPVLPFGASPGGGAEPNVPGGGDAPGQSPPPKALAPQWGHHRVSLPN